MEQLSNQNSPNARDPLLSNTESAEFLGISPGTLEVWRSTQRYALPYVKVGRLVKYRKSTLDAFIEARTIGEAQ